MFPNVQILGEDHHKSSSKVLNKLRTENFLTDVTLVTEDFTLIPAHKIILTAISGFFEKLFRLQENANQTLICLQSVNYLELTQIIKYIYHGEVEVPEDNLNRFLGLAERFSLKGLLIERQVDNNIKEALLDKQIKIDSQESFVQGQVEIDSQDLLVERQVENDIKEILYEEQEENNSQGFLMNDHVLNVKQVNPGGRTVLEEMVRSKFRKIKKGTNQNNINTVPLTKKEQNHSLTYHIENKNQHQKQPHGLINDSLPYSQNKNLRAFISGKEVPIEQIDDKVLQLYKKTGYEFSCLKCPKVSKKPNHMKEHVEKHIIELNFICKECGKQFSTRGANRYHFYRGSCNKTKLENLNK